MRQLEVKLEIDHVKVKRKSSFNCCIEVVSGRLQDFVDAIRSGSLPRVRHFLQSGSASASMGAVVRSHIYIYIYI